MAAVGVVSIGLLFCLLLGTVKSHTTACNHGNDATCLYGNATYKGVRQMMNDTDSFWFGSKFQETCPLGDQAIHWRVECFNPAPEFPSIIQRLRQSNDGDTTGIEQYLKVHFLVPAGQYQACHSRISAPMTDKLIDPVHSVSEDSWALNHKPNVTWEAPPGVQTTLVFWDAGWFQLHGLWINNAGGSLENGQEVIPYSGPKNPLNRKNPAVFALFRQNRTLDHQKTYDMVQQLITYSDLGLTKVHMADLKERLGLTGPMAVSILSTSVDTFSAQYGQDKYVINNCPVLRRQVMISEQEYLPWNTTATELTMTVDLIFYSRPITFNSCCHEITMKLEMFYMDSRARALTNTALVRDVPYYITLLPIHIRDDPHFFSHPNRWFTLMMLDTTHTFHNVTDTAVLHWQIINIRDLHAKTGVTTVAYKPPHIPVTSPDRRYVFMLLEQTTPLTAQSANYSVKCDPAVARCVFDLHAFMRDRNLTIVGLSEFRAHLDDYARHVLYSQAGENKATACAGVGAFSEPCPSAQTCSSARVVSLPSLSTVMAVVGVIISLMWQ